DGGSCTEWVRGEIKRSVQIKACRKIWMVRAYADVDEGHPGGKNRTCRGDPVPHCGRDRRSGGPSYCRFVQAGKNGGRRSEVGLDDLQRGEVPQIIVRLWSFSRVF